MNSNALNQGPTLRNGVKMPWIGLGVWRTPEGEEVENSVKYAINAGYRSIDTAMIYGNEEGVGKALKECGVPIDEIFVTTKVWNDDQGYEKTLKAFDESRRRLGLEIIDLYLVHWPINMTYRETWKALIHLKNEGLVKSIGVSNFNINHLETIIDDTGVIPDINQIELHPMMTKKDLLSYANKHNIRLTAWSPLMVGKLDHPKLMELSKKYNKTVAQIIIRWDVQNGIIVIPKSVHENRIIENSQIFDYEISDEDMKKIDDLNENKNFGPTAEDMNK